MRKYDSCISDIRMRTPITSYIITLFTYKTPSIGLIDFKISGRLYSQTALFSPLVLVAAVPTLPCTLHSLRTGYISCLCFHVPSTRACVCARCLAPEERSVSASTEIHESYFLHVTIITQDCHMSTFKTNGLCLFISRSNSAVGFATSRH